MEDTYDVIVAGAGLAGLAAAATAARSGRRVLVVDGHAPGGRARTDDRSGFLFNQGAHALYLGGHATGVLGDLGLPVPSGGKPSNDLWGIAGGVVSRLPFTASGAVSSRLVDTVGKAQLARVVLRLRSLDPATVADRSAAAWLHDLGLRPGAAEIMRTLAHVASYADDLDAISADAVAAQLKSAVSAGVRYLDGGWQVLVDELRAAATSAGAQLRTGTPVVGVEADADGGVAVQLGGGATVKCGAAVLAVGGPAAVASLLREPPRWGLIGPPATVACLDLGLRRPPRKRMLLGVGEPLYFSTHTPAAALAPPGRWVAHVMRYGVRDADTDRADLWAHARVAGVDEDDVVEHRFLARMVVTHSVPVPGLGLGGRPRVDAPGVPGVYVAGDWVGPDGLLADGALASGAAAGQRAVSHAHHALGVR
jgi:phytoene dehydrogenase-like protein